MSTLEDRDFIVTLITSIATICSAYCAYLVASANSRHIRKIMRSKYDFVFKPNQDSELTAEMYREEVDKYFKETFGKPTELKLFDGQIYFVVSLDEDIKDETIQNMLFLRTYENAKLFQCTYTTKKGKKLEVAPRTLSGFSLLNISRYYPESLKKIFDYTALKLAYPMVIFISGYICAYLQDTFLMLAVCLILIMMGFCMHWYLYKKKETYLRKLIDARIEDHDKKKESEKYGFKV